MLDVRESVHRDTTMKVTNRMHYIGYFIIPSQIYMLKLNCVDCEALSTPHNPQSSVSTHP